MSELKTTLKTQIMRAGKLKNLLSNSELKVCKTAQSLINPKTKTGKMVFVDEIYNYHIKQVITIIKNHETSPRKLA